MATDSTHERRETVTQHFERVWQRGEFDTDVLASDFVVHSLSAGGEEFDLPAWQRAVAGEREAFPDLRKEPEDVIASEDKVVVRYTARGTHEGEFRDIPPTGTEIEIAGIGIFRLEDDRIAEAWYLGDFMGLLQQVGAIDVPT
jgi:steroid delta-isomerase-like uncharacterized protein